MNGRTALRGFTLLLILVLLAPAAPQPAYSVTKNQVKEACAASQTQYDEYLVARSEFERAALEWETTLNEIEALNYKRDRVSAIVDRRQDEMEATGDRIQELAVQLYIQGGGNPGLVFFANSVDELITGSEFLAAATEDDIGSLDDMVALRSDLDRFTRELEELDSELRELEVEQRAVSDEAQALAEKEREAFSKLSGRCKELQAKYDAEQAAVRARRAARSGSGASGVGAISGFVCPFWGSSFIDSWGYPRSGGRTHKGVDMMGPHGAPLTAVGSGVVYLGGGGLGGKSIWLVADNGYAYYYAHLSGFAVSSGTRVSANDVIGYNGNTGNARGGSPHLHFEIHPGGRGAAAVNPYPTVAVACR